MKIFILLFFTLCFPIFIFITTIVYASDITPILKSDLTKHQIYTQLSKQLGTIDTGDSNSAIVSQFIQSKFTSDYLRQKVETAMDSSDKWVTGKSTTPPVISFKDVKDEINTQYPQLLPSIMQASQELKQQETQNPDMQQNPQAAKNIDMIASLAKSDFTIPLTKYLIGLKNFYTTIRILQPILGILLILSLIFLGVMNKSWHQRFKWFGFTLLFSSIWGFAITYSNASLVAFLANSLSVNTNHAMHIAIPIALQLINHYVDTFSSYQKIASIVSLIIAAVCFILFIVTPKSVAVQAIPKNKAKKK
jgi:hypothetical protein